MAVQTGDKLDTNLSDFDHAGLPSMGFVRLKQILGDKKAHPPTPPIIPVSPASWWNGVKSGIYPSAVKISSNVTAWRVKDIRDLIERINNQEVAA
jgi:prophage regulatory protein